MWPAWDTALLLFVNRRLESPAVTAVMAFVTRPSNWILPLGVVLLLAAWWGARRLPWSVPGRSLAARLSSMRLWLLLAALALSAGMADFTANMVKHAVPRQRPCRDPAVSELVVQRDEVHGNRSFPSAHAANSAALAFFLTLALGRGGAVMGALAFLVGFSRVYNGVHYPLDVYAGWSIGMISAGTMWTAFRKRISVAELPEYARRFRKRAARPSGDPPRPWEQYRFKSLDGLELTGFIQRRGPGVALVCHGLHSDMGLMGVPAEALLDRGYSVLLVPFRGHDGHPLARTSGGPDEAMDLAGAVLALLSDGFRGEEMLFYGSSMGAATAVKTACLLSSGPLKGVIAHGCFTSFFDSARHKLGGWRTWLLRAMLPGPARRSLESFSPLTYLPLAPADLPFVFLCGSRDSVSPPDMSARLASAAGCGSMIVLGGTGHPRWGDPDRENRWQFEKALDLALEKVASRTRGKSLFVDEEGGVRDVPATGNTGAGSSRTGGR